MPHLSSLSKLSKLIPVCTALVFAGGLTACISPPNKSIAELSAGDYALDKSHASLMFSVQHIGLSWYTMRFNEFDASIIFDSETPENSSVSAVINPLSIDANHPTKEDWNNELATDEKFLSANKYPDITFNSTAIKVTGENTGIMTGDLTLLGVTKPIEMTVTFQGSNSVPWAPGKNILGFSANGKFNRSEFGMNALLPNTVSDEVRFQIEAEFSEG